MSALKRVTRWADYVRSMLKKYGLAETVPLWVVLAQIHIESAGYTRPEQHYGDQYSAEGLLQMQPVAAEDCGVDVAQIDGLGTPTADAIQSIDCWGKLQRRYNGGRAPIWDYVLLWKSGSGTLSKAKDFRDSMDYWSAWWQAASSYPDHIITVQGVYQYAIKWLKAAQTYSDWQYGATS